MSGKKLLSNVDVKKINRNKIFRYINSRDGVSKPEVAKALGISTPTVLQNVKELLDEGYIEEVGEMKSTGGRKAVAVTTTKKNFLAIGVDITRNHIGIVVTDLAGNILFHDRIFSVYSDTDSYYKDLADFILKTKADRIDNNKEFIGVGISIPGIIDENKEEIVYSHTLGVYNLSYNKFSRYLPFDCEFINDANSACLAETYKNYETKRVVYLSLSNSVGGSIVLNNQSFQDNTHLTEKIYFGDNKRAGEFGHFTLYPDGRECYCGKKGCFDSYCSAVVLAKSAGGRLDNFFENLQRRDEKAKKLWDKYLKDLAIGINNLRMIFDCTVIVGGYVGSFIEPYIEDLKSEAKKLNTFENDASYIKSCKFKIEASATGAAIKQIEKYLFKI